MPDRKQLLEDFYAKYAPDQELTVDRLNAINTKYGDDNKKMLSDFYAKYAPNQELSDERFNAIESKYNLKKKASTIPVGSETSAPIAETGSPTSPLGNSKATPPSDFTKHTGNINFNAIRSYEGFQQKRKDYSKQAAMNYTPGDEYKDDEIKKSEAELAKLEADATNSYKIAEPHINGLASSVIESGKINFLDEKGKINLERIDQFATNVAESQGMPGRGGYFHKALKQSIQTGLEAKKVLEDPAMKRNFNNLYKASKGKDFDFKGKEAAAIFGQAKIQQTVISNDIKNDATHKLNTYKDQYIVPAFKEIETSYKGAVEHLQAQASQDPEASAIVGKIQTDKQAELSALVQQGQITEEMANKIWNSEEFKAQTNKAVNDFIGQKYKPAFEAAYKQYSVDRTNILNKSLQFQNKVSSRAETRYKRQMNELAIEVERKTKGLTGDKKELGDMWNKAFQITAKELNLEKLETENQIGLFYGFANTAISSFAHMMKTSADCFGLEGLSLSAEIMEKNYQGASDPTTEFKDLFNWSKISRSSGQMAGSMLPSVILGAGISWATGGSQIPMAGRIAMAGMSGFAVETPSIMGEAYSSMLAKTGLESDAEKAYVTAFKSQVASIPLYMVDGIKFFPSTLKKVPFLGKTVAGRAVTGAVGSFTDELLQEGTQSLSERAYMNKQDLSHMFDEGWFDNLKVTGLNIAPTLILGAAGPTIHSGYYSLTGSLAARKLASSKSFANLIPEQKSQFLARLALRKSESFVNVVLSTMLTSGSITQDEFDNIAPFVANIGENRKLVLGAKKNGANNANQLFLSTLFAQRDNFAMQVQKDPSLQVQLDELEARIGEISSGKNEDLYGITYKDNSQFVFDKKTFDSLMSDKDFIDCLKNRDVSIFFNFTDKSKVESAEKALEVGLYGTTVNTQVESIPKVKPEIDEEKKAQEQAQLDKDIIAYQERTGWKPDEIKVDLNTGITIDRLRQGIPVDPVAIEEASSTLYKMYKRYEILLGLDSRRMTTDQIKNLMSELEDYITRLENVKNGKDFNSEVTTEIGDASIEAGPESDTAGNTSTEAPKAYQDSISSRDVEAGFGEDTVEMFLGSQYYADIVASAKAEGLTAAQVLKDLYKNNAFDNLETREDIDTIEVQLKRDIAADKAREVAREVTEPIDKFIEANYTQIVADLKLANKIKTKGCGY
jgi:hypothetical protein